MPPPLIPDPQSIPVVRVDDHLPAIPASALTPAALRERLARLGGWEPERAGDGQLGAARPGAQAAVLMALVERGAGLQVLLTRRTAHLRTHAGQISFPGGRSEPSDAGPVGTALREAEEEIGLPVAQVEVIGQMPAYVTVTDFVVTPVVALVAAPLRLTPDPFEVAEVFEVPLVFLMNPAHHRHHVLGEQGGRREFLSMPWHPPAAQGPAGEYFIWGATAAMLRNLYRFLAG